MFSLLFFTALLRPSNTGTSKGSLAGEQKMLLALGGLQ